MTKSKNRRQRAAHQAQLRLRKKARDGGQRGDPKAAWIEEYKSATGTAAVLELKLRLLADLFPELGETNDDGNKKGAPRTPVAHHATNVEAIRQAIVTALYKRGSPLAKADGQILQRAVALRNDLMHTDFHGTRELLHKAGVEPVSAGVLQVPVPRGTPEEVFAALTSQEGAKRVSDMDTSVGTTYGWLIELGQAGYFKKADQAFQEALKIVDGLAWKASGLPHRIPEPNIKNDGAGHPQEGGSPE